MEHFDWQAKDWDNDPDKVERAETFAKEIAAFIKPDKKLTALEFGCGTGLLSFSLKESFSAITLADSSEGMINVLNDKIAAHKIDHFKTILGNLLEDNIELDKNDVVYTLMTLHHIINVDAAMLKFNELLNENGFLCIADLVKEDGSFHAHVPNFDGHNGFSKEELIALAEKHGFALKYYNICHEIKKDAEDGGGVYPLFLAIFKKCTY